MIKSSDFSACGKYRYLLTRVWDESKPVAMCIGLNPSTAGRIGKDGEEENDATINRLESCLKALGFGGLKMVNLYAIITSKPSKISECPDPMKGNELWLETTAYSVQEIIFCWGQFPQAAWRAKQVQKAFPDAKCFGKNKDGTPWHPLAMMYAGYKGNEATLIRYK